MLQQKKLLKFFLTTIFLCLISSQIFAQEISQSLNSSASQHWQFYCTTNSSIGKAGEKFSAKVPGTIHLDLLDNKLIPDPFYADNEKRLQWIDTLDWVYETTFDVDSNLFKQQHIELQFDGLDTYADVYLNGEKIITADNMFVKWDEEVKRNLKLKNNQLKIVFRSTLKEAKKLKAAFEKQHGYELPEGERVFVRKAQYQFGWDFAPKFLGCGIWRNVKLNGWNDFKIENIFLQTIKLTPDSFFMNFELRFKCFDYWKIFVKVKNEETNEETSFDFYTYIQSDRNKLLKFSKPKLWWNNDSSKSHLTKFKILVSIGNNNFREDYLSIGIRTIELIQQKDSIGESFYFKLNDKPIIIKGANWVPADVFLPRVTHRKYRNLLIAAKDAHLNMLRVWGGGIYEDEYFYDLCDSLGIMVWQDLPFACSMYPADEKFLENVKNEIHQNVLRLQNHPCVVLFCGNNEMDEGWKNWGWQEQYNYSKKDSAEIWNNYKKLFEEIIPKTLKEMGCTIPYIPSSPKFGWGHKESLTDGDSHYWGVWWGMEPYEIYKKRVPRFASEYGMQSLPCLETIRKFAPDSSLRINSVALRNHQKHPTGFENLDGYLKYYGFKVNGGLVKGRKVISEYGKGNPDAIDSTETSLANLKGSPNLNANPTIKEFEDYINATQQLQADALKTAITAHLKAQPRCMGTIIWQLNDCWPGASWSLIDYYGNKKKAYYEVQKLFAAHK